MTFELTCSTGTASVWAVSRRHAAAQMLSMQRRSGSISSRANNVLSTSGYFLSRNIKEKHISISQRWSSFTSQTTNQLSVSGTQQPRVRFEPVTLWLQVQRSTHGHWCTIILWDKKHSKSIKSKRINDLTKYTALSRSYPYYCSNYISIVFIGAFWAAFTDVDLFRTKWALAFLCFSFLFIVFLFLVTCTRLS